ncbi:hypothetical protein JCM10207_003855 [Rhodosporidiobolus poonsookiae]
MPHARLTFAPLHSSPLHSLDTFRPSSSPSTAAHDPAPPTVDATGAFSLLGEGGVQVGDVAVHVQRGTLVSRVSADAEQLNGQGKGLWWKAKDRVGVEGRWTLWLINASEADVRAVQRILLFLPPVASEAPTPAPAAPAYRNSLILYDEDTRSVVGVLPLSTEPPERPHAPAPESATHASHHLHPREPSPSYHPSASTFASYIDHVVHDINPTPTSQQLTTQERVEAASKARLAEAEERSDEFPPLPTLDLAVQPGEAIEELEDAKRHEQRRLEKGFKRLDLEMDLATGAPPAPSKLAAMPPPESTRPVSTLSVSSFATFGTERFYTADEAQGEDESSRRSSFADVPPEEGFEHEHATHDKARVPCETTPRPTLLPSAADAPPGASPAPPAASTSAPAPAEAPAFSPLLYDDTATVTAFDPTHTLTHGNAVLLSFFNTSSALLPSAASLARSPVTAHPLSASQASEMTLRGEIVPAQLAPPGQGAEGADGKHGWWTWLGAMFKPVSPGAQQQEAGSAGWWSWLVPSFLAFDQVADENGSSSSASTAAGAAPRRRELRRASGEATARLSVYAIDEAGWGRRAFVAA